jgi:dTDP-4-dehydrorhamnose 3,5-epimerase
VTFTEMKLKGVFLIEPELLYDERGFFARTCCEREFAAQGLECRWVQSNISFNRKKGTLRGLHYQMPPYGEVKLIRCTLGAIFDVIVDLRQDSPAFRQHVAVVLSARNRRMLYVPKGCAHGFQTLEDETEVFYQMSEFHVQEYAAGVRWDDPAFSIQWPDDERTISQRDRSYADYAGGMVHRREGEL